MFAASEMGTPVQPTAEERIATTANEKAWLLDMGNGSSLPDPSTLKDWLRESDAITSSPPIFLSYITVFLVEDHPGKDVGKGNSLNGGSQSHAYVCVLFKHS